MMRRRAADRPSRVMSSADATKEDRREHMLGFAVFLVGVTALVLVVLAYTVPNVSGVLIVLAKWTMFVGGPIVLAVAWLIRDDEAPR